MVKVDVSENVVEVRRVTNSVMTVELVYEVMC